MALADPPTPFPEVSPPSFDTLRVAAPVVLDGGAVQDAVEEVIHRAGKSEGALLAPSGSHHMQVSSGELKKPRPLTKTTPPPEVVASRGTEYVLRIGGGSRVTD